MHIRTPSKIQSIAWEGQLAPPASKSSSAARPIITLGRPEIWSAVEALENEVGKKWIPPLGGAEFWLVRLACTLHEPPGRERITEVEQRLYLRPRSGEGEAYAYSLFPDRLGVKDKASFTVGLSPELKFGKGVDVRKTVQFFGLGEIGTTIEYRKVFPVIQSYGAGEPSPYWVFKSHASHLLEGCEFVYAIVVAKAGAGGIRASLSVVVTVENLLLGRIRYGLPEEARKNLVFSIPGRKQVGLEGVCCNLPNPLDC